MKLETDFATCSFDNSNEILMIHGQSAETINLCYSEIFTRPEKCSHLIQIKAFWCILLKSADAF